MVVAQLAEGLLPLPEVRGFNSFICKILYKHVFLLTFEKTIIKKKLTGNGPFF